MSGGLGKLRGQYRAYDVLILSSLIWFLGQFVRYSFPPLFETFQVTYGVSNTVLGLLFSALLLAYGGMQFPSGVVADRVGRVTVISGGVLILSVAVLLLFSWQIFPVLVVAVVLIGVGTGMHKTVAIALLSIVYPDRTGRALGVLDGIGQLGGVVAPAVVSVVLAVSVGWHSLYLVAGVFGVVFAVLFYRSSGREYDNSTPESEDSAGDSPSAKQYLQPFRKLSFVLLVLGAMAFTFAWNGLAAFFPLFLISEQGMTSVTAGLLYSLLFILSLVQPVTGSISDRVGYLPVMIGTLIVSLGSVLVILHPLSTVMLVVVVFVMGIGFHGFRPAREAYLMALIPAEVSGGTLGIVRTLMMIVGGSAPAVVGFFSEVRDFTFAFNVIAFDIVIGIVILGALYVVVNQTGLGSN